MDSSGWRQIALTVAILATAAALLTIFVALNRSSGSGPPRLLPVVRDAGRPPHLDADGDLDGSLKTLRLHFDPDDAR